MGKFGCKGLLLLGSMMLWGGAAQAQYLRSSYFMEGTSARLQLNPGLQPTRGYFNVPIIGSFNMSASSNVLGTSDIIDVLDAGDDLFSNDKLFDRLKTDNRLNVNLNTDILSFGWYKGKGFWSVNVGLRADVGASIPSSMFEYLRDLSNFNNVNGGFSNMNFDMNAYAEVGLGYSRRLTEKLTVGGRVKVLLGIARAEMEVDNFEIKGVPQNPENPYNWRNVQASATMNAHVSTTMKGGGLSFDDNYYGGSRYLDGFDFGDGSFGIAGAGFGVDLGASYKVWDNLTVSAAVLDLGFINWKGSETVTASPEETSISVNENNYQDFLDEDFLSMDRFKLVENTEPSKSVKKSLAATILLAGEYGLFNNKLSVGAMYSSRFVKPKTLNELTFLATFRPKNWLNAAISYSPIQASGKSIGLAVKLGPLFVGTDYMFFGGNSKSVNGFLGISFPLGGKAKPFSEL